MSVRIFAIQSLSCGPTAVCSVTGESSNIVIDAMTRAAAEDGRPEHHWRDSAFRDQVRACELLGLTLSDRSGNKVEGKKLPMNPPPPPSGYQAMLSIQEFVRGNRSPEVILGFAVNPSTGQTHSFALDGQRYFDCNTSGQIVSPDGILGIFNDFKVVEAYSVQGTSDAPTS